MRKAGEHYIYDMKDIEIWQDRQQQSLATKTAGLATGLPFGVAMKNITLGIPIGLRIGVASSGCLQRKAEKKGRTI